MGPVVRQSIAHKGEENATGGNGTGGALVAWWFLESIAGSVAPPGNGLRAEYGKTDESEVADLRRFRAIRIPSPAMKMSFTSACFLRARSQGAAGRESWHLVGCGPHANEDYPQTPEQNPRAVVPRG
jgi:hypothetical protein